MQLVKVGLCAFGMSGKVFHAPFLKEHPGFSMSAVVERSKNESKEKYPETTIYSSVEEMLQNADIEVVVVNTPVQTHFEYAKNDKRFSEMIDIIESKANSDYQFTPESVYQKCKDWDFGQKKHPSEWLTYLCLRILERSGKSRFYG